MSERRRLWIRFRRVAPDRGGTYAEATAEADRLAIGHGAHFWAFEADGREDLVVEFLEGPSDTSLSALDARSEEILSVAAGEAGSRSGTVEVAIEPEGLRCTEVRAG